MPGSGRYGFAKATVAGWRGAMLGGSSKLQSFANYVDGTWINGDLDIFSACRKTLASLSSEIQKETPVVYSDHLCLKARGIWMSAILLLYSFSFGFSLPFGHIGVVHILYNTKMLIF